MNRKVVVAVGIAIGLAVCCWLFVLRFGEEEPYGGTRTSGNSSTETPSDDPVEATKPPQRVPLDPTDSTIPVIDDVRADEPEDANRLGPTSTDDDPVEFYLEGLVVTEDGVALPGAEVSAYVFRDARFTKQALELFRQLTDSEPHVATGRTDRSGYFRIPLEAGGKFQVVASSRDRASGVDGPVTLSPREPSSYLIFTLPPEVILEGIVLSPTGRSLSGVPVSLVEKATGAVPTFRSHQAMSGADGRFRFTGLEPRSYILMAKPEGGPGRLIQQVEAPSRDVVVRVDQLQELVGFVRDAENDRPVAGALLTAVNPISFAQTTSDDTGAFVLELSGEDVDVMVTHPDYLLSETRVPLDEGRTEITFSMQRGDPVEGRVVKNDGTPVPNALVGVLRRGWLRGDVRTTRADANGEFTVTVQGGGTDLILARVPGWVPTISISGALPVGARRDLVLQPSADIAGIVLSGTGQPVSGAWIRLHPTATDDRLTQAIFWLRGNIEGWSGTDGTFELRDVVPYVAYQLEVRHPDHPDTWRPVGNLPATDLEVVLTDGSRVDVVLTTPEGQPPSSAVIIAQWPGGATVQRGRNGNLEGGSRYIAGSDGVAVLRNVPVGRVVLYVVAPRFVEERFELDIESGVLFTHEVQLRASGRIDVLVLSSNGQPVAAAEVRLMTDGGPRPTGFERRGRTGTEGEFSFTGVAPGRYQVWVTSGSRGQTRPVVVTEDEPTSIEIRMTDA